MMDLVARAADEWNCNARNLIRVEERCKLLDERLAVYGRQVRRSQQIVLHPGSLTTMTRQLPEEWLRPSLGIIGSVDQMQTRIRELDGLGFEELVCLVDNDAAFDRAAEIVPELKKAVRSS
jgi:hypothetical protein